MQSLIETHHFSAKASKLLAGAEMERLRDALFADPKAGDLIRGTSGFRKLRLARDGQGKSGGFRVIYFLGDKDAPMYLIDIFAKNMKENLTKAERNALASVAARLKAAHRKD